MEEDRYGVSLIIEKLKANKLISVSDPKVDTWQSLTTLIMGIGEPKIHKIWEVIDSFFLNEDDFGSKICPQEINYLVFVTQLTNNLSHLCHKRWVVKFWPRFLGLMITYNKMSLEMKGRSSQTPEGTFLISIEEHFHKETDYTLENLKKYLNDENFAKLMRMVDCFRANFIQDKTTKIQKYIMLFSKDTYYYSFQAFVQNEFLFECLKKHLMKIRVPQAQEFIEISTFRTNETQPQMEEEKDSIDWNQSQLTGNWDSNLLLMKPKNPEFGVGRVDFDQLQVESYNFLENKHNPTDFSNTPSDSNTQPYWIEEFIKEMKPESKKTTTQESLNKMKENPDFLNMAESFVQTEYGSPNRQ